MADTHSVMPKKLAQALMDASVQHFDFGGAVQNPTGSDAASYFGPGAGATPGGMSLAGGSQNFGPQNLNGGNIFGGGDGPPKIMGMSPMSNFNATMPEIQQQNFAPQIGMQQLNQAQVYQQQQSLANQLLAQSQGKGPGQTLVAQQAGQNAAQQGALMASQRGASGNAGLIGRQSAMAGAQGNQQALNTQAGLSLQSQSALQQQQASMANQSIQAQSVLQGGQAAQNSAITQGSLGVQNINSGVQAGNAKTTAGIFGGMSNGAGGMMSSLLNKGGTAGMADGGTASGAPINDNIGIANYSAPGIGLPTTVSANYSAGGPVSFGQMLSGGHVPGQAIVDGDAKKNDTVATMLSPGEDVIPRSITQLPEKEMEQKAIEFLRHLHKGKKGYGAVAEARKAKG